MDPDPTSLEQVLRRYYPALIARAFSDAESDLGYSIPWDAAGAEAILEQIGARAAGMTDTLRATIRDVVNRYGDDYAGAARELQDRASLTADKAMQIARSEAAYAFNRGTALAAKQAGLTHLYITDGDQDAPCADVNGTYQPVAWLDANPTAHPNCTRRGYLDAQYVGSDT